MKCIGTKNSLSRWNRGLVGKHISPGMIYLDILPNKILYLCAGPEAWGLTIPAVESAAQHRLGKLKGRTVIWPRAINPESINPTNFIELMKKLDDNEMLIIDRIKGTNGWVSVKNHINRSGANFLIGRTPYNKFPRFPDISQIYHHVEGFEKRVVHTVGPKRFCEPSQETGIIWSEAVGLIAPVAHYAGFRLWALGGSAHNKKHQFVYTDNI